MGSGLEWLSALALVGLADQTILNPKHHWCIVLDFVRLPRVRDFIGHLLGRCRPARPCGRAVGCGRACQRSQATTRRSLQVPPRCSDRLDPRSETCSEIAATASGTCCVPERTR